jgi:hypothetical protein
MSGTQSAPQVPWKSPFRIERRHRAGIVLVVLACLGFAGVLEKLATWGPFGNMQGNVVAYLDTSEKKAVEAFAVARAINASVSLLKSADLSAVVAQVAPMEVLEPVDDLAKQFSDVMVVSIVSILVQRLILAVSQAWALNWVFPAGCLLLALSLGSYRFRTASQHMATIARTVIMLALFGRFAVVAASLVGANITDHFLSNDLNASMTVMHASGGNLDQASAKVAPVARLQSAGATAPAGATNGAPATALEQIKQAVKSTADSTQAVFNKGAALVNAATMWVPDKATIDALVVGLPDHIVKAIEIFLVQTLLMPLAVTFLLYSLLHGLIRPVPLSIRYDPSSAEESVPFLA